MINPAVSLKEHLQHRHVPQNARLQRAEASAHEAVRNTGETQIAVASVHPGVSRLPRKENVCRNVKSIKATLPAATAAPTHVKLLQSVVNVCLSASSGRMILSAVLNVQQNASKVQLRASACHSVRNIIAQSVVQNAQLSALKGQSMAFAMPSAGSMKGTPTVVRPRVRPSVPTGDVAPARPPGCLSATMFQDAARIILTFSLVQWHSRMMVATIKTDNFFLLKAVLAVVFSS